MNNHINLDTLKDKLLSNNPTLTKEINALVLVVSTQLNESLALNAYNNAPLQSQGNEVREAFEKYGIAICEAKKALAIFRE
jgi:hypothetical protein